MPTTNLGRVLLIPKGSWDAQIEYSKLDFVINAGSSYVAKDSVPAGTPVSNTTYWQLLASKGETGGLAQMANEFSTTNTYSPGDYCIYNGDLYRFTDIHMAGPWTGDDVTPVSVSDELARKADRNDLNELNTQISSDLSNINSALAQKADASALNNKQDALTFDSSPTSNSNNPVKSSGIYTALAGKAASSHEHSAANITSGTLGIARGGTGKTSFTTNSVLIGNNTSALKVIASASGAFYSTGANVLPEFGILPIAQGGIGKDDTGWKTLTNSTVFTGTIYYKRIGFVNVLIADPLKIVTNIASSSGTLLGTLTGDYCPDHDFAFPIGTNATFGMVTVKTSGAITLYKHTTVTSITSSQNLYLHAMFMGKLS